MGQVDIFSKDKPIIQQSEYLGNPVYGCYGGHRRGKAVMGRTLPTGSVHTLHSCSVFGLVGENEYKKQMGTTQRVNRAVHLL